MTAPLRGDGALDRISRVNALRACTAGQQAFQGGQSPDDCPYIPTDDTGEFLAHFWLAGWWMEARPGVEGAQRMHFARTMTPEFRAQPPPGPSRA